MKPKMLLLLFTASLLSVIVVACSEVVFPTPLPTATPAPTATPIVFPTHLPTATPLRPSPLPTSTPPAIVFPTPLPTATPAPTATPISIPSPLPTATPVRLPTPPPTATPISLPSPVAFPTPLPTATPVLFPTSLPTATPVSLRIRPHPGPDAFARVAEVKVMPLDGESGWGAAFQFKGTGDCVDRVCLLTVQHVVGDASGDDLGDWGAEIWDGSQYPPETRLVYKGPKHANATLDIAVVVADFGKADGLSRLEFAAPGTEVVVGEPVRVVTFDFYEHDKTQEWHADQMVLSGIVSRVTDRDVEFMIDAPLIKGNSGGVVLNAAMRVIGMVTGQLQAGYVGNNDRDPIRSRNKVVHVDAIRDKLCEWGYLDGSDCS